MCESTIINVFAILAIIMLTLIFFSYYVMQMKAIDYMTRNINSKLRRAGIPPPIVY